MPLSRHWLAEVPTGKLDQGDIFSLDVQLLKTMGLEQTIQKLLQSKIKELLEQESEIAASREQRTKEM